jgi:hypothetical protein
MNAYIYSIRKSVANSTYSILNDNDEYHQEEKDPHNRQYHNKKVHKSIILVLYHYIQNRQTLSLTHLEDDA